MNRNGLSPDSDLEALLKILIDRFGPARSLAEVYAKTYALRVIREGGVINLTDVAEKTGISKQNLSRWRKSLEQRNRVLVGPHDEDGRIQNIDVVNLESAGRHLPRIAEALGVEMDAPISENLASVTVSGESTSD